MLRYLRYGLAILAALVLVLLSLANRDAVVLRLLPPEIGGFIGLTGEWNLPLFLVILVSIALGVLVGYLGEWLRAHRQRGAARRNARELERLQREVEALKAARKAPTGDEVLAILDETGAG